MLAIVVAQLQKHRGQPDRGHNHYRQWTKESAALGVHHDYTQAGAKQGGRNHGPAARVGSAIGHEDWFLAFIQGFAVSFKL
jgi:hypothetical protein